MEGGKATEVGPAGNKEAVEMAIAFMNASKDQLIMWAVMGYLIEKRGNEWDQKG